MISSLDIMHAIRDEILSAGKTDELIKSLKQIHVNLNEKDFKRPCALIEYITNTITDANHATLHVVEYFTITIFVETDQYRNSKTENLLELQNRISLLFRKGYLLVNNRNIHVVATNGGRDWDKAYIDVQFDFYDKRSESEDTPDEIMENLHTRVINETDQKLNR